MRNLLVGIISYAMVGIGYAILGLFMLGLFAIGLEVGATVIYLILMAAINTVREIVGWLM